MIKEGIRKLMILCFAIFFCKNVACQIAEFPDIFDKKWILGGIIMNTIDVLYLLYVVNFYFIIIFVTR